MFAEVALKNGDNKKIDEIIEIALKNKHEKNLATITQIIRNKYLPKYLNLFFKTCERMGKEGMIAYNLPGSYFLDKEDYKNATKYFELGNKSGDFNCIINLSTYHSLVKKDMKKAFEFIKKAADLNHPSACHHVAGYYIDGDGVEKNNKLGIEYFTKSHNMLFFASTTLLEEIYYQGYKGIEIDFEKSYFYFKQSYEVGDLEACYYIGVMNLQGHGMDKILKKHFNCFNILQNLDIKNQSM
jgi:TPR repeat protein